MIPELEDAQILDYHGWDGGAFQNLNIMDIDIHEHCNVAKHPVETGESILDNKTIMPREVTVKCLIDSNNYDDIASRLYAMLYDKTSHTYSINTKKDQIENLILYDIKENEDNKKFDVFSIDLIFIEQLAAIITEKPKNPENKKESKSGECSSRKSSLITLR